MKDWLEVARLAFKGKRFEGAAFDVDSMPEVVLFHRIVVETTKAVWRQANPKRLRLPKKFDEEIRFAVRKVIDGSAVIPLEVYTSPRQSLLSGEDEKSKLGIALRITLEAFRAIEKGKNLPDDFPRSLVPVFAEFGKSLRKDESLEMSSHKCPPARVTRKTSQHWAPFFESTHSNVVETVGSVKLADVHAGRFHLWLNATDWVLADFTPEQEEKVTEALKHHKTARLRVTGTGSFSPAGKLMRITKVETLALENEAAKEFVEGIPSIGDQLRELAKGVPTEAWKAIPPDATEDLDRHLYGRGKA